LQAGQKNLPSSLCGQVLYPPCHAASSATFQALGCCAPSRCFALREVILCVAGPLVVLGCLTCPCRRWLGCAATNTPTDSLSGSCLRRNVKSGARRTAHTRAHPPGMCRCPTKGEASVIALHLQMSACTRSVRPRVFRRSRAHSHLGHFSCTRRPADSAWCTLSMRAAACWYAVGGHSRVRA
jgi:hypothetical protein